MVRFATFALGFTMGWATRSTTESSRALVLTVVASALTSVDRIKRAIAIEREHLEDLVAEARARADVLGRVRAANGTARHPAPPVHEAAE